MQFLKNLTIPEKAKKALQRQWDITDRIFKTVQWAAFTSLVLAAAKRGDNNKLLTVVGLVLLFLLCMLWVTFAASLFEHYMERLTASTRLSIRIGGAVLGSIVIVSLVRLFMEVWISLVGAFLATGSSRG